MMALRKDEKGVSPVIGVILMVAITVILAAVIASFVFGLAGTMKRTYAVAATATKSCSLTAGGTECTIYITYQGGPDHSFVKKVEVKYPTCENDKNSLESPSVGDTLVCRGNAAQKDHVVVAATFTDGSEQVILDTLV
jgi:flagellin-like protein